MKRLFFKSLTSAVLAIPLAMLVSSATAQDLAPQPTGGPAATESASFPSDAELAAATPMDMIPTHVPAGPRMVPATVPPTAMPQVVSGAAGVGKAAKATGVYEPAVGAAAPENYGSSGVNSIWHFNDRLVQAYTAYPYRTYGKLYFQKVQNGGWFTCTGALISRSIVVTAGHCVHRGNKSAARGVGYNYQTYFIPSVNEAFNPDYRPYGYAFEANMLTTTGWFNNGSLNSTLGKGWDVGLLVLRKRVFNNVATTEEMGFITGWNGYCDANCLQPYWALSQYGYPSNYYAAQQMTESQHLATLGTRFTATATGDYVAGSGMQGGSSGGPSVANPGDILDSSVNKGLWPFRNIILAVTSWGYTNDTIKVQGYSPLSGPGNVNNFKGMFNTMCIYARSIHGAASCSLPVKA